VTKNPLMHVTFLIHIILKTVSNLLGTIVGVISPIAGFRLSLLPANVFFNLQMNILSIQIKWKMQALHNKSHLVVPVAFQNGVNSLIPAHGMHMTYLIVEKNQDSFNLYWVNRPKVSCIKGLNLEAASAQIRTMLDERFPNMDIEKVVNNSVTGKEPSFNGSINFVSLSNQGSPTNCVVSNMFGMLETLDLLKGQNTHISNLRYRVVREALFKDYSFYQNDFFPFADASDNYSLSNIWEKCKTPSRNDI
jgi:hypothetical protein